MRLLLFILLLSFQVCFSQTTLTFSDIPATTDISGPGGSDRWNENSGGQIVSGVPDPWIFYRRFFVSDVLNSNGTHKLNGKFREKMTDAAEGGQLFGFRIATLYPSPDMGGFSDIYVYDGNFSVYPEEWHTAMQAEGDIDNRDFNDGESWIPGYNGTAFLTRYQAMWVTVKNWFDTAFIRPNSGPRSGQAIPARSMIAYVEVSGIGSYGEMHHCCLGNGLDNLHNSPNDANGWRYIDEDDDPDNPGNWKQGRVPSVATWKAIIDMQVETLNTFPWVAVINILDGKRFQNTEIPVEVGIYALTKTNDFGFIGLRRDQVANDQSYYHQILEDNTMSFGGVQANTEVMVRYQFAPFVGEPQGGPAPYCPNINMGCAPKQVRQYHMYSFGNGNYGSPLPSGNGADSVRLAFRLAGARIKLNGGSMTTTLTQGATFNVNIDFQNIGLTPEYRIWNPVLELRTSGGAVVWRDTMNFDLKFFQPAGSATNISDNFTLPGGVATGTTYRLVMRVADPTGYMRDYPLGITGREETGAIGLYELRNNITVQAGTGNQSPVAVAGADQIITLPTNSVNVDGSASFDPDGTIVSYSWSFVSGVATGFTITSPASAATTITFTTSGVRVFRLIVTDNDPEGFTGFDDIQITVQPEGSPPLNNLIRAGRFKYKETL